MAPIAVRAFNFVSHCLPRSAARRFSLHSDELLNIACERTGLDDYGDKVFRPFLDAALDAVSLEGELSSFGQFTYREFTLATLANRLRIVDYSKRSTISKPVKKPIIIIGLYRTGSTYLHNLLSCHKDLRSPLFWQLKYPVPLKRNATAAASIARTKREQRIHRYLSPAFNRVHPMDAEKPEECLHLFEPTFASTTPFFITAAHRFGLWLLKQDLSEAYSFYAKQLGLLEKDGENSRWLLKWPYHTWHLDKLYALWPDAHFIFLHRDPVQALSSVSNLAALAKAPFCTHIDRAALNRYWLDYCDSGLQRAATARVNITKSHITDIRYSDLVRNPIDILEKITRNAGLETYSSWYKEMQGVVNNLNRNHTPQPHSRKTLEITPEEVRERFRDYIDNYDLAAT